MGKDKFSKRKARKRLVKSEMVRRGILAKDIAQGLNLTDSAVSHGLATSPRIVAALIAAGVPERLFVEKRARA
ncbi:MAG: hypothetical protein ACLPYB_13480 [Desulfobaccales bacterium]